MTASSDRAHQPSPCHAAEAEPTANGAVHTAVGPTVTGLNSRSHTNPYILQPQIGRRPGADRQPCVCTHLICIIGGRRFAIDVRGYRGTWWYNGSNARQVWRTDRRCRRRPAGDRATLPGVVVGAQSGSTPTRATRIENKLFPGRATA